MSRNFPPLKVFRRSFVLFAALLCCVIAVQGAAAQTVTLRMNNQKLSAALDQIRRTTNYDFVYNNTLVDVNQTVSVEIVNAKIEAALDQLLKGTGIGYKLLDRQVTLFPNPANKPQAAKAETVSGRITDEETGEPLPGAVVSVRGRDTMPVSSDLNGNFSIAAHPGDVLEFSYLGMNPQTLTVAPGKPLRVVLVPDKTMIQDIVVTGYQTISRERATGAFDILSNKALEKPSVNIAQRIVGKVAGINADLDSEGNVSMIIRGQGTFLGRSPLVVVDGFAIDGGFGSINPNDVESVTVLKDAAAASIWGARASNGVIVVTTKRAKKNAGLHVDFSSFVRVGSKTDLDYLRNMASSAEQIAYEKMTNGKYGYIAMGSTVSTSDFKNGYHIPYTQGQMLYNQFSKGEITEAAMKEGLNRLAGLDNRSQIEKNLLQRPIYQQYNLSLSGGSDRMTTYVSMLYSHDTKRYQGSRDDNMQFDYRGQMKVFKWLDFNLSAMMRYAKYDTSGSPDGVRGSYMGAQSLGPYDMLLNEDGSEADMSYTKYYKPMIDAMVPKSNFPYSDWSYNPIREIRERSLESTLLSNRLQAGLTFKIIEGLTFDTKFQYERIQTDVRNLYNENTYLVRSTVNMASTWDKKTGAVTPNLPKGSFLDENTGVLSSYDFRNQVSFDRTFAHDHNVNFIGGVEIIQSRTKRHISPRSYGYNDDQLTVGLFPNGPGGGGKQVLDWIDNKVNFPYINSYKYNTDRYFSMYANLSYTYKGRYSVSGSVRNDASNFITDDPKYRYSPFWSVGGSWLLSDEGFLASSKVVNLLKVRATYGYNGNSDNSTSSKPLISINGVNAESGYLEAGVADMGNPLLRWERTGTFNLGVDFDLFGHKLYGKVDYYNKHGKDILAYVSIPMANGATSAMFNNAEITNQGLEFELGSRIQASKDFSWEGSMTFSYNRNRVKKLLRTTAPYWWLTGSGGTIYVEGQPINSVYSYRYAGVRNFGTEADKKMMPAIHLVGDEVMPFGGSTTYDGLDFCEYQGTSVAPYVIGMSHTFSWRSFDLSFTLTGKFGHIFRRTGFNYPGRGGYANAQIGEVLNGDPQKIAPMPYNDNDDLWSSATTGYLDYLTTSANNVRLQELTFSYSLPRKVLTSLRMTRATVYLQGNNLFTIKSIGEDPDYRYGTMRLQPSYIFGIKFGF